jgi:HSP20 family protein
MDRQEDAERNIVSLMVELPGIKREDIEIALVGNELTISGTKIPGVERGQLVSRERRFGRFTRTVEVTAGIKSVSSKKTANLSLAADLDSIAE